MAINPHDLVPSVTYPIDSIFAQRLSQEQSAKQRVAAVVGDKFLKPGVSVVIGDGSSAFYVGLAVLHLARSAVPAAAKFDIKTNNQAIGDEIGFGAPTPNVIVETSRGAIDAQLFAAFGEHTDSFMADFAAECECAVFSVNGLFKEEGPYGVDAPSLRAKRAALKADFNTMVLVTDHTKLAALPQDVGFPVFSKREDWDRLMNNLNLWVYTTRYPDAPAGGTTTRLRKGLSALSKPERYSFQAHHLRAAMGDRFVEVA